MSELLTIAEAAARLRVSVRTVYRLIADRKLRVVKVRGSSFVRETEIGRYLENAERSTRVA